MIITLNPELSLLKGGFEIRLAYRECKRPYTVKLFKGACKVLQASSAKGYQEALDECCVRFCALYASPAAVREFLDGPDSKAVGS